MIYNSFIVAVYWILCISLTNGAVHDWGYHHGIEPDRWPVAFPTCGGEKQSPIDIQTNEVKYDRRLETFDFEGLSTTEDVIMDLQNNGHAVQVGLQGCGLKVTGGSLPETFIVEQFHFHWGSENARGSEHEIDGKHFAMEMHVVMHSEEFSSVNEAMNTTNGLAVLGFFIDVGAHNPKFEEIISHLHDIEHKNDHVILKTFSLTSLFPSTDCYYRYYGSLTTPMCYESVIWTIFREHIYLSESQLNQFRHLGRTHFKGSEDLINNYRNPQPINCRTVTSNCKEAYCTNKQYGTVKKLTERRKITSKSSEL